MFRYITWVQLFGTLGVLPILAVWSARRWPRPLQAFFWAIVPVWIVVHPFVSVLAEARLFLVPLTMIFIPGALFGIVNSDKASLLLDERQRDVMHASTAESQRMGLQTLGRVVTF